MPSGSILHNVNSEALLALGATWFSQRCCSRSACVTCEGTPHNCDAPGRGYQKAKLVLRQIQEEETSSETASSLAFFSLPQAKGRDGIRRNKRARLLGKTCVG